MEDYPKMMIIYKVGLDCKTAMDKSVRAEA